MNVELEVVAKQTGGEAPGADSVISIVTVRLDDGNVRTLLDEANDVLQLESKKVAGFLGGELLMSLDHKTLVIRTEWADIHAWSKSRYDGRVGVMLEHCNTAAKTLAIEVYLRHAVFGATVACGHEAVR